MNVNARWFSAVWIALGLILGMASVAPVAAGVILQNTASSIRQINTFEAIGQSFTAEDAHVKVALYYTPLNTGSPNTNNIRVNLYQGDGLGGSVLDSDVFFLANGFDGFLDSDFSSVTLTVGALYTFVALIEGDDEYWGVMVRDADVYAGGRAWSPVAPTFDTTDMRFRVTPVAVVTEPAVAVLLAIGIAGMVFARRPVPARRNKEQ